MNTAYATQLAALVLAATIARADEDARPATDPPVVQVLVTQQIVDPFAPWQKRRPEAAAGYGVLISGNRILTTEHLVRNAAHIDLRLPRVGALLPARVIATDPQVNLALLHCVDERLARLAPADPARDFERGGPLTAVQLTDSHEVQNGDAQFIRAHYTTLPTAPHGSLVFDVLTDLSVNGQGAPVFRNGRLFGLIMTHSSATRIATVLPGPVIARFMDSVGDPPYGGFASAGFVWRPLADPATREWLGMGQQAGGVLVLACIPGSGAAQALRPNDVVLAWDGKAIDELGYYDDPDLGRMLFPFLIKGRRATGETSSVRLLRDGQPLDAEVALTRADESAMLIPDNTANAREPFLVEGGLVFRELSGSYIQSHGSGWERSLDAHIGYLYASRRFFPPTPGQRVVVISGVLPHPVNVGYQQLQNAIVTAVNGRPVSNMGDVFAARDAEGCVSRVTLTDVGVDIAMDALKVPSANEELSALYRMPRREWRGTEEEETQP